jgi:uncharacterized protein (TIGR00369 family)
MMGPSAMGRDIMRYARLELEEVDELHMQGRARVVEHLRGAGGNVRAGALLTMLDSAGGICGGLAALPDGWVVSTNMSARTVSAAHGGPLLVDSRVLRKGRHNVVTTVEIRDAASAALVLDGVLTSAILAPESGPPEWQRPVRMSAPDPEDGYVGLAEWLQPRALDDCTIEMDLRDALRNPWGILHGGVVAALVDAVAEHATRGGATADVVVHYLAPNRIGPVRAVAERRGLRSDGAVLRVEVRDEGAGRVTAVAVATVRLP